MTSTMTSGGAMSEQPAADAYLLSDLRREACLTQAEVAERMNVSRKRVGQIESSYPNVRFDTLVSYMQALGGHIRFVVGAMQARHDRIVSDPALEGTREWLSTSRHRGIQRIKDARSASKELVLQGEEPHPGGDDTGRDVDHADTHSDEGDGGQGE